MRIRLAGLADLPAVLELDQVCFGSEAWGPASWADEFGRIGQDRVVLVADEGAVVGYAALLVPTAAEDPVDLLRIAVTPAERRTGIGGRLLTAALASAAGRTMLLEVADSNKNAWALYAGAGFVEISRRHGYYPGGEDALIMQWQGEDHE
ncbi:MAG: [ribosomal protein S18]-alanine N-acetyltransferase [Kribbellaceae bacterium]|nr:[ribosomal protein S18]-alanine N-acetyltransferase [Kribbellaceae bacterium]